MIKKPFKKFLGKDAVYNLNDNMIEVSKYCIIKNFNKELMMTKADEEDFKSSTKYLICDNDNDVKYMIMMLK